MNLLSNEPAGRKFTLCVLIQLLHILLLVTGYLPASLYHTLTLFVLGGYLGANVVQKYRPEK